MLLQIDDQWAKDSFITTKNEGVYEWAYLGKPLWRQQLSINLSERVMRNQYPRKCAIRNAEDMEIEVLGAMMWFYLLHLSVLTYIHCTGSTSNLPPSFYREIVVRHKTKTGNTHLVERQEDGKQENEILRFEKFTSGRRVADPSPEDACYAMCWWCLQNMPIYLPPL